MSRGLLARLHNPRGYSCDCLSECFCKRSRIGRALMWSSAIRRTPPSVIVRCPTCGQERLISRRRASTAGQCQECRFPNAPRGPTDADRAWWLRRFDDETLAELAAMAFGAGDPRAVSSWRLRLLG
jgi:hypothetical protein